MWLPSCMSTLTRIKSNCLFPTNGEISKFILTGWKGDGWRKATRKKENTHGTRSLVSASSSIDYAARAARARNIMHRPVYRRVHLQMHLPNRYLTRFSIPTSISRALVNWKRERERSSYVLTIAFRSFRHCSSIPYTQSRFLNAVEYSIFNGCSNWLVELTRSINFKQKSSKIEGFPTKWR